MVLRSVSSGNAEWRAAKKCVSTLVGAPPRDEGRSSRKDERLLLPIASLRPTQAAVGMRAVEVKRRKLERRLGRSKKILQYLGERPIPSVLGPGGELFIVDHHHLSLALLQAEVTEAFVQVIDDLSQLPRTAFWQQMEAAGRLHPFDEAGRRMLPSRLPRRLTALRHDPYRDLAWSVREAGAFEKSLEPYSEFRWAAFFRTRIAPHTLKQNYDAAVTKAIRLTRHADAAGLPGFVGR